MTAILPPLVVAALAWIAAAWKVREMQAAAGVRPATILDVLARTTNPVEQAELAEEAAVLRARIILRSQP